MNSVPSFPIRSKVTIKIAEGKRRDCSLGRIKEICTSLFYQAMDLITVVRNGPNIAKMQEAVIHRDPLLPHMKLPFGDFHFANHPAITEAIFKPHRDGELFLTDNQSKLCIFQLLSDMLEDPQLSHEYLVFTCSKEKTREFRTLLQDVLSKSNIVPFIPVIEQVVQHQIQKWPEMGSFDLAEETHRLTCAVLSKVLLGVDDDQGELADAMLQFFEYISSRFLKKPIDMEKVRKARELFFEKAKLGLLEENAIAKKLEYGKPLGLEEKRYLLFSLFFAGTDSSVSSLIYCLLKCAQDKQLQQEVREKPEAIRKILAEGLRVFTPVIGVTRIARADLEVNLTHGEESMTWNIPQGALLVPSQNLAARCPMLYPDSPDQFFPDRHQQVENLASLPWKPFGSGAHPCPGASLYEEIAHVVLRKILCQGELSTDFQGEPAQTGHFINKLAAAVEMSFQAFD